MPLIIQFDAVFEFCYASFEFWSSKSGSARVGMIGVEIGQWLWDFISWIRRGNDFGFRGLRVVPVARRGELEKKTVAVDLPLVRGLAGALLSWLNEKLTPFRLIVRSVWRFHSNCCDCWKTFVIWKEINFHFYNIFFTILRDNFTCISRTYSVVPIVLAILYN